MTDTTIPHNVILIDADCLLCHGFAKFIISQDVDEKFKFGALQDETLKSKIESETIIYPKSDSVLLYTGSQILQKSRAVLYTFSQLPRYRQRTRLGYILPRSLADTVYDVVASRRKKRFGEQKNCDLATTKKIQNRLV